MEINTFLTCISLLIKKKLLSMSSNTSWNHFKVYNLHCTASIVLQNDIFELNILFPKFYQYKRQHSNYNLLEISSTIGRLSRQNVAMILVSLGLNCTNHRLKNLILRDHNITKQRHMIFLLMALCWSDECGMQKNLFVPVCCSVLRIS